MPPDIQEFRARHPSLSNSVLLDLGGPDGTDAAEKADAVFPDGTRIALRTIADLQAMLEGVNLPKLDGRLSRLTAMGSDGNELLQGPVRYEALMLLQRQHDEQRTEEHPLRETIPMEARSKIAMLLSRAAAIFC